MFQHCYLVLSLHIIMISQLLTTRAHRLIDSLVWNDYNRKFRGGTLEKSTTDFVRSLTCVYVNGCVD